MKTRTVIINVALSLVLPMQGMIYQPGPTNHVVLEPFQQRFDPIAPLETLFFTYEDQAKPLVSLLGACVLGGGLIVTGAWMGWKVYKCYRRAFPETNSPPSTNGNSVSLSFQLGTTNHTITDNVVCGDCGQVQAEVTYNPDNTFTLRLDGGTNAFILQRSTNLVHWETVCQILAPNEQEILLTAAPSPDHPQEFFKLIHHEN